MKPILKPNSQGVDDPYDEVIATQEQEALKSVRVRRSKLDAQIVAWNVILYLIACLMILLIIQHAVIIYGWPLRPDVWIDVPVWYYFFLGAGVWAVLKFAHFVAEMGMVWVDEAPAKKLEDGHDD